MPKRRPQDGKPQVHKELEGFELNINEFGEIITNFDQDTLNQFLNRHVDDKKLRDREDLDYGEEVDEEEEFNKEMNDSSEDDELPFDETEGQSEDE